MSKPDLSLTHTPVFVGGLRRSGTTLMRKVLGSHSELSFLSTELNFFERFYDGSPVEGERFESVLHEIIDFLDKKNCPLSEAHIIERLGAAERSWKNLFIAILDEYREEQNKTICGEKSPLYEFYLPHLDEWFGMNGYRFIHVIRSPLNNYASSFSGSRLSMGQPIEWALSWNKSVGIALKNAQERPRTYKYVLYDEFVRSPEEGVVRICEFLGLEPQVERMLAMSDYAWQVPDNSSFLAETSGHAIHTGKIRKSDDLDRAGLLDETSKTIIRQYCASLASILGYEGYEDDLYSLNETSNLFDMDLLQRYLDRLDFKEYVTRIEIRYFLQRLGRGLKNILRSK